MPSRNIYVLENDVGFVLPFLNGNYAVKIKRLSEFHCGCLWRLEANWVNVWKLAKVIFGKCAMKRSFIDKYRKFKVFIRQWWEFIISFTSSIKSWAFSEEESSLFKSTLKDNRNVLFSALIIKWKTTTSNAFLFLFKSKRESHIICWINDNTRSQIKLSFRLAEKKKNDM